MNKPDIKAGYLGVMENGEKAIAMNVALRHGSEVLKFVTERQIRRGFGAQVGCDKAFNVAEPSYKLVALYGHPKNYEWFSIDNRPLLWRREEPVTEMTITEIEQKLGIKNLKIVKENI